MPKQAAEKKAKMHNEMQLWCCYVFEYFKAHSNHIFPLVWSRFRNQLFP